MNTWLSTQVVIIWGSVAVVGGLLTWMALVQLMSTSRRVVVGRLLPIGLVWLAAVALQHTRNPREHHLYFDEDVYANIALNIARGHGPVVTAATGDAGGIGEPYKWPVALPVLSAPLVARWGADEAPAVLSECAGSVTIGLMMWIAWRRTGSPAAAALVAVLVGSHPLVGGWSRAGAAEPLALCFSWLAILAATEHEARSHQATSGWLIIQGLAACLAVNTRLDAATLVVALATTQAQAWRASPGRTRTLVAVACAPSALLWLTHVSGLREYYLSARPESSFALSYFGPNLLQNLRSLTDPAFVPLGVLFFATSIALVAVPSTRPRSVSRQTTLLVVWLVTAGVLLCCYSAGQYQSPGGSRFLLTPFTIVSLGVAVALSTLMRTHWQQGVAAAAVGLYVFVLPTAAAFWRSADGPVQSPRLEHAAVVSWAGSLPRTSLVLSRTPYLWDNANVASVQPELAARHSAGTAERCYAHLGLFDPLDARSAALKADGLTEQTPHGPVLLVAIPCPFTRSPR